MKKLLISVMVMVATALASGTAMATPAYYLFEGQIISLQDEAGLAADTGLSLGSRVVYVVLIDEDEYGTYTGATELFPNTFYAELVSSSPLQDTKAPYYQPTIMDITALKFGTKSSNNNINLQLGSSYNLTQIASTSILPISDWKESLTFSSSTCNHDENNICSCIQSNDLTLKSISSTPPVLESDTQDSALSAVYNLLFLKFLTRPGRPVIP